MSCLFQVRFGWTEKIKQLKEIREIIHHERYNVTGLAQDAADVEEECKGIAEYADKEDEQADKEDEELKTEEKDVGIEIEWVNSYPCDCLWAPWSPWTPCSARCGGGKRKRGRLVDKPAINGGVKCLEQDKWEKEECNSQCCRKYF